MYAIRSYYDLQPPFHQHEGGRVADHRVKREHREVQQRLGQLRSRDQRTGQYHGMGERQKLHKALRGGGQRVDGIKHAAEDIRITSYNVCYTKLLRTAW